MTKPLRELSWRDVLNMKSPNIAVFDIYKVRRGRQMKADYSIECALSDVSVMDFPNVENYDMLIVYDLYSKMFRVIKDGRASFLLTDPLPLESLGRYISTWLAYQ